MGFTILQGIDNEYSGDTKKRLSQFIFAVLSPSEYFATKVNKAVKKKNEKAIMRIITTRHEIDMEDIKGYYLKLYGKEMTNDLKSNFSGDFYNLLAKMVGV